ncbi:uncharacterized protein LOC136027952 isoform X3 [Artemia franciscana]
MNPARLFLSSKLVIRSTFPVNALQKASASHLSTAKRIKNGFQYLKSIFDFQSSRHTKLTRIPRDYEEVYNIGLENFIIYFYIAGGGATGILALSSVQHLIGYYRKGEEYVQNVASQINSSFKLSDPVDLKWYHYLGGFSSFCIYLVSLGFVVRTVPLRMYYSEVKKDFLLVYQGRSPLKKVIVSCKPGQVKDVAIDKPPYFKPWKRLEHLMQEKKIYISNDHFKRPTYYNILCGYQKV